MKVLNGQFYEVGNKNHNGVSCDRYESIKDAEQGCISNWVNQRIQGYKNHDQVIFLNRWERAFEDDGTLITDNHSISYQRELLVADCEDEIQMWIDLMK